jgi:hypothetical protein
MWVGIFLHIHRQSRLVMGVCNRDEFTTFTQRPPPITKTNGAGNGNPAPTKQPPQTTPHPTPPTAPSRTSPQQPIQPTVTSSSQDGSPTPATSSVPGDPIHAGSRRTSEMSPTDTTSISVEGSGSHGGTSASQSLAQLPNPSSSLGGAQRRDGTSKGRIIAAVLGSILGAIIIVIAVFFIRRRRRHSTSKLEVLIATQRKQEREPSIHDPRYQRNRGFYLFNHTHRPNDGDNDVERRLSRTSYSSSSFSLTTSADTIMEEKLNFRLDHPL